MFNYILNYVLGQLSRKLGVRSQSQGKLEVAVEVRVIWE